jgi:signal transduction histidine kinase
MSREKMASLREEIIDVVLAQGATGQCAEDLTANLLAGGNQLRPVAEHAVNIEPAKTSGSPRQHHIEVPWSALGVLQLPFFFIHVANVNEIECVLLNLCMNPCDAMPEGGALTFEIRSIDGANCSS